MLFVRTSVMTLLLSVCIPVFSQAIESAKQPQHNFPVAEQVGGTVLVKQRDEYLNKRGWALGQNTRLDGSEFYLVWESAPIRAKSNDMNFPDARVAAFEEAVLRAKGQFAATQMQTIASETIGEFLSDDRSFDPSKREGSKSQLQVIGEKITALAEGALDNLLRKLDIDPSQYSAREKRVKLRATLTKSVVDKAIASTAGIRPLSTFEDGDSIGVLMVYSKEQQALANSIRQGTTINNPAKAGKATIQQVLGDQLKVDGDYIMQHGVRIIYDHRGAPWLVAFGQSGVKATNQTSKLKLDMLIQGNRQAAASLARAQLAEFLQSTVSLTNSTDFLLDAEIAEITEGDMTREEEALNIGKLVQTKVRQQSKVSMPGIITLRQWTANHPDSGHLIVGEMIAWSPDTAASARSLKERATSGSDTSQGSVSGGSAGAAPKVKPRASADFETEASF